MKKMLTLALAVGGLSLLLMPTEASARSRHGRSSVSFSVGYGDPHFQVGYHYGNDYGYHRGHNHGSYDHYESCERGRYRNHHRSHRAHRRFKRHARRRAHRRAWRRVAHRRGYYY